MAELPTIRPGDNGPYLVRGLERLRNSRGEELPVKDSIALCRCGGSQNKPFCDGTHKTIGFSGERESTDDLSARRPYAGRAITINDSRAVCSHCGRCAEGLPAVFRWGQDPWIDPDGAAVEQVIETVLRCPSGALSCTLDGTEYGDQEREPAITVSKNGPYHVTGGIVLDGPLQPLSREHYTLCRCGRSRNKPFCDGSHWRAEFRDERN